MNPREINVSEKDLAFRLESQIVDVLDAKRWGETRSSYLRRAIETALYGKPRSRPTSAEAHKKTDPFSRHRATGTQLWVQIRLRLSLATKRDMYRRCLETGQPVISFIRQAILETALRSAFLPRDDTMTLTLELPVEIGRRVDHNELISMIRERWGDNARSNR